jgi:tetratricopeptide (TPR) repeat protein
MLLKAEALVDLEQEAAALPVIEAALASDSEVSNGWLLKATLARRLGRLEEAEAAILEAVKRTQPDSPDMADVQLEAGAIAQAQGQTDLARAAWTAAASGNPELPAVKAAAAALARLARNALSAP